MASSSTRRELGDAVRLLGGGERRLFLGLIAGAAGYLIWLAGTGVAVDQFLSAAVGPVSIDPWSSEASLLTGIYVVLWVLVPSLVAVWLVVGDLTNIRGNVEKRYRLDQPIVLLVPPLIGLVAVCLVAVVRESFGLWIQLAIGLASAVLLVRTVAYGYRVYSLSVPRFIQGLLFLAAAFVSLAVASRVAPLARQDDLVRAAARRYGVYSFAFGTVEMGGVTAPVLPLAGAIMPAVVALTYVWFQIMASLIVRARRPDVPRSDIRAGQRYPNVVRPGTTRRLAMGTVATDDDESGEPTATDGSAPPPDEDGDSGDTDSGDGGESGDDGDDTFGDTRVYTPPSEADDDTAAESADPVDDASVESGLCPICGATYDADRTHCPNCNAVLDEE